MQPSTSADTRYQRLKGEPSDGGRLDLCARAFVGLSEEMVIALNGLKAIGEESENEAECMGPVRIHARLLWDDIRRVAYLYEQTGRQIETYRQVLKEVKRVSDPRADRIADLQPLRNQQASQVARAQIHYNCYRTFHRGSRWYFRPPLISDEQMQYYEGLAQESWDNLQAWKDALQNTDDELEMCKQVWEKCLSLKDQAALRATGTITSVFEEVGFAGAGNLWESFSTLWHNIPGWVGVIAEVLGVICFIVGLFPGGQVVDLVVGALLFKFAVWGLIIDGIDWLVKKNKKEPPSFEPQRPTNVPDTWVLDTDILVSSGSQFAAEASEVARVIQERNIKPSDMVVTTMNVGPALSVNSMAMSKLVSEETVYYLETQISQKDYRAVVSEFQGKTAELLARNS